MALGLTNLVYHYFSVSLQNTKIHFKNFIAQMAEVNKEEPSQARATQEASTLIYDASSSENTVTFTETFPMISRFPKPSLDYLLGRPLLYGNYAWSTALPEGENVLGLRSKGIRLPSDLFKFPEIAQLLRYHNYFRPKIRFLVKINGTPMHYGKLVCYYGFPDPTSDNPDAMENVGDRNWLKAVYNYKWAQISANTTQTLSMEAPYMAPFEMTPVNLDRLGQYDTIKPFFNAGEFNVRVAVPLQVNGEGNPSIDVSIFVVIDDLGRVGVAPGLLTPSTRFEAQGFDYGLVDDEPHPSKILGDLNEAVQKTKGQILPSKIANDLGNWFGCFTKIPYIGFGAEIGKYTAKLSSTVLKYLGYSVPSNLQAIVPIAQTSNRIYQADDLVNSIVMAPTANAFVSKDLSVLGCGADDYDITSYCSHMMLLNTFAWRTDQTAGQVIYRTPVSPGDFCNRLKLDSPQTGQSTNVVIPTRIYMLQRLFDYWRGSFRFHLSVSASRFHSGRLRITWVPYYDKNIQATTINDNYMSGYPSIILDVAGDTDVSFSVPYFQPNEWCTTKFTFFDYDENPGYMANNGYLVVSVINRLASNEATATSTVYTQFFVGGGPDLQFAMPNMGDNGFLTKYPKPYEGPRNFRAEMAELSSDMLNKTDAKPIYPINGALRDSHCIQSTDIVSLKQLLNMGGPVAYFTAPTSGIYMIVINFNWSTSTICADMNLDVDDLNTEWVDYLTVAPVFNYACNLLPIKAMARGSYRVQLLVDDLYPTAGTETIVTYSTTNFPGQANRNPDGAVGLFKIDAPTTLDDVLSVQGTHWFKRYSDQNIVVDIPYYGITRACPAQYVSEAPYPSPFPSGVLIFRRTFVQGQKIVVNMSCGDDFQFAYDIMLPFIVDQRYFPPQQRARSFNAQSITNQSDLDTIVEEDLSREEDPF